MSIPPRCQAKNPAACQYHGSNSERFTRIARERLLVAREVHQVSYQRSQEENLQATEALKQAELEYYGTDEGRNNLLSHINQTPNEEQKRIWQTIIQNADMKRELQEATQNSQAAMWGPPEPKPKTTIPHFRIPVTLHQRDHTLAEGRYSTGEPYSYNWDSNSGFIYYSEGDDIDSMRSIGNTKDPMQTEAICLRWHARQER